MRFSTPLNLLLVLSQAAANYPTRPVTVIVSTTLGGPVDFEARLRTTKLLGFLGHPFILDYKPGTGTTIGAGYVARASPMFKQ